MSLTTFDLPTIFACGVELAQATANFRPEDHQRVPFELSRDLSNEDDKEAVAALNATFEWHRALDAIVEASNRLKRALGAKGPLDACDQLRDKATPTWEDFQNQFKYAAHSAKVRKALCKVANAAVDLSGYATVRDLDAELRQCGLRLLGQGVADLWEGLSNDEREKVKPLLSQASAVFGWQPDFQDQPVVTVADENASHPRNASYPRIIDIGGGFATRSADFFEKKAAALAQAFPAEPAAPLMPLFPSLLSSKEDDTPMDRFPLDAIFEQAIKYAVVIWDKKSQVRTDRDPFDCVPNFSEIGVARCHFCQAMRIPSYTKQGWRDAVKKEPLSELARQGLIHLNQAEEWEHLPRDNNGNRQPGSLGTAFGLFERGLKEVYLGMSTEDQEAVKVHLPLIRERWDKDFPSTGEGGEGTKKNPIPKEEANILIRQCLKKFPEATIKEIHEATKVSTGAISQSPAWQAHQAAKVIRKDQPNRQAKTIPLTEKMLRVLGQSDDPSAPMAAEEAVWRHLLENASPEERGKLNKMNSRERADRIQAVLDQVTDQVDSERQSRAS